MDKSIQYAAILSSQFSEIFDTDHANSIDLEDFEESENIKAFIHALASLLPCSIYNRLTGDNKNHLEFNHLANQLCFEYMDKPNKHKS